MSIAEELDARHYLNRANGSAAEAFQQWQSDYIFAVVVFWSIMFACVSLVLFQVCKSAVWALVGGVILSTILVSTTNTQSTLERRAQLLRKLAEEYE
jgi:hypothetical protein